MRGIPDAQLTQMRATLRLPVLGLETGVWKPDPHERDRGGFAVLVIRGMLTHEILLESKASAQIYGPGDVAAPWTDGLTLVPAQVRWTAADATVLGVLDRSWIAASRRWPVLGLRLNERLGAQAHRTAVQQAVAHVGRVELRVLGMLWQLADRWGKVSATGMVVPIQLTHESLGRLIGAQRPTVTLAVGALEREGLVARRGDGAWVLEPGSQDRLAVTSALGAPLDPDADQR